MFNIDWNYFIRLLLPPRKRRTIRIAWLILITSAIRSISSQLNEYRGLTSYKGNMRGCTIYLEKLLNDKFNGGNTGLIINPYNAKNYLYVSNINAGDTVYVENNASTNLMLPDVEFYKSLANFEVLVPSSLNIDINQLRAELAIHVYATKFYIIKGY
jgi:hypothetical protein